MSIEKAIFVVNQMVTDGIIENYALGGATAVIFYTEPIATEDLDIFVHIKPGGNIFTEFSPIYDYLKNGGYATKGEHILLKVFPFNFCQPVKA